MQPLHRISASDLQTYLETPEELLTESEEIQIAVASFSETPRSLLEILVNSDCSTVVEVARLHVNFAGEITGDYQETVTELLQNLDLGQNDRLAVELMQFAPVAPCFLSEWVPESPLIQGLQNEYMPLQYRLQFLERLSQSDKLEARLIVAESLETPISLLELLAGDLELAVRLTVESNPNCPSEVVELVKSQHDLGDDWDADFERLRELGESRWSWIRLTVAQNPFAPEDVLMKLATDGVFRIRLGVGKNPNVGEEALHQLYSGHKNEIKKRDNLQASILERFFQEAAIEDVLDEEYDYLYFFLKQENTPTWILAELANNVDIEELTAKAIDRQESSPVIEDLETFLGYETDFLTDIAKHPQVSVDILEHLTQYPNSYLKLAIAENPKISEELRISLLQQLSANLKANIRIKIASNLQTPIVILEQLANASYKFDGMEDLFRLLASDITPNLLKQIQEFIDKNQSPELVLFWLNQGIEFRDSVLEEWTTLVNSLNQSEKQTLEYLANQESLLDWEGRYTARRRSNKRGEFSFSSNELAKNHRILDALMHLANTQYNSDRANQEVVAALLGNPSLPIYLRERLWEQYKINPDNERDYLEDFDIRLALANNPQIPEAERINYFQEIISKNPDYARRIARDARTPVNILEQLLERGICKEEIAKNPAIPEYLLRRIADERKEYLWRTLAENPSTPLEIYQFSCSIEYSCFAIVGQLNNQNWICVTSSVPQETPDLSHIFVVVNNLETLSNKYKSDSESQINQILESLKSVLIYGHYYGGYDHTYLHKIIYKTASTKQTALQNALIASGFLQIATFKSFYPDEREYLFQSFGSEEEGEELYQKYQHLNSFLKAKFPELILYTFRFWDYTQLFILGESTENDRVGLRLTSEFDYNP